MNWLERYAATRVGPALQKLLDEKTSGQVRVSDLRVYFDRRGRSFFCHTVHRGRDVAAVFPVPPSVVLTNDYATEICRQFGRQ